MSSVIAGGMADILIAELGKAPSLRVISRQSSQQFKDKRIGIPAIGRQLGVDTFVEGSVLRVDERIRVTVQLIHARPERHLWADTYECAADQLFAEQPRVARAIATAILAKLAPDSVRGGEAPTVNPLAQVAYLRGRYHMSLMSPRALEDALACFRDALRADPAFGPAQAAVANTYNLLGFWG